MQKVTLLRFGTPNPAVSQVIAPFINGKGSATIIPGAVLSVFNTESSIDEIAEIAEALREIGALFLIQPWNPNTMGMPKELVKEVERVLGATPAPAAAQTELTLDELLDLINRNGIESLSPEQRRRLESF